MLDSPTSRLDARRTNTLFEEAYWLDAVAPGAWRAVQVERDGRVVGRLPYVLKRRFGLIAVSTAPYTPWLGPWIAPGGGKGGGETGRQHEILAELAGQLPHASRTLVACAPEVSNIMALGWAGYELRFSYTYRLNELADPEKLWRNLRDKTRNTCRKAEKLTSVNAERPISDIFPILEKTYRRQSVKSLGHVDVLARIDAAMRPRGQCALYAVEDAGGRIHGFSYVVFDDRHCFYIAGGGDPEFRDSGAQTLAVWTAIKSASSHSKIFDFEGSSIPAIERFVRGFGPTQTLRLFARRTSAPMLLIEAIQALLE
ncbi:MAG: GNAT family N-acetyltransferase [Candidatus Nanopelagicales bacterium]